MRANRYFGGQSLLAEQLRFSEGEPLAAEFNRYVFSSSHEEN